MDRRESLFDSKFQPFKTVQTLKTQKKTTKFGPKKFLWITDYEKPTKKVKRKKKATFQNSFLLFLSSILFYLFFFGPNLVIFFCIFRVRTVSNSWNFELYCIFVWTLRWICICSDTGSNLVLKLIWIKEPFFIFKDIFSNLKKKIYLQKFVESKKLLSTQFFLEPYIKAILLSQKKSLYWRLFYINVKKEKPYFSNKVAKWLVT